MVRRFLPRDSVAITGSIVGLVSLFLDWLVLRPNRLAAGQGLNLWESTGWAGILIAALWLACFILSWIGTGKRQVLALGIAANCIIVITFVLVGFGANQLLASTSNVARVSLSGGFWLTLIGAYIAVFAARQRLSGFPASQNLVSWLGIAVIIVLFAVGWMDSLSILQEFLGRKARFFAELGNHVILFAGSVIIGVIIGIPLGIWALRSRRAYAPILYFASITQTIPSLALFGILIAPLTALSMNIPLLRDLGVRGIGTAPAMIALVIYSLLPIVRNTYTGLHEVDPATIDAGLGMGMSRFQVFRKIEAPLAAPLVLEGIRTAAVQAVGLTVVAALIGAGGLGWFIFQGIGQAASDLVILGAIPIIILAVIVDAVMRAVIGFATPKGMGERRT